MSQDGFILRSVLYGMFLGLAIIAGWLYHPHILAVFHSAAPEVADHLTAMKDKIEKVKLLIPTPPLDKKETAPTRDVPATGAEAPAPAKQMVQDISKTQPREKQTLYPFWRFDESRTAEDFMSKIQKRTGVDLTLGQEGYRYVVYIPAASEEEKREKAVSFRQACMTWSENPYKMGYPKFSGRIVHGQPKSKSAVHPQKSSSPV